MILLMMCTHFILDRVQILRSAYKRLEMDITHFYYNIETLICFGTKKISPMGHKVGTLF